MEVDTTAAGFQKEKLARIGTHLRENYVDPGKIPGCQVLVSRHGIPAYFESMGLMDRERNKAMRDDTIFRIYSMTKPITSVALMMLWEEGRFQLTDPVHRFIPSWRDQRVWQEGSGAEMVTAALPRPSQCSIFSVTPQALLMAVCCPAWRRQSTMYTKTSVSHEGEARHFSTLPTSWGCSPAVRPWTALVLLISDRCVWRLG